MRLALSSCSRGSTRQVLLEVCWAASRRWALLIASLPCCLLAPIWFQR